MNPPPGRIVLYRLPDGPFAGEQRPAVVVRVSEAATKTLDLRVFVTPGDGMRYGKEGTAWVEGVRPGRDSGEWSWS